MAGSGNTSSLGGSYATLAGWPFAVLWSVGRAVAVVGTDGKASGGIIGTGAAEVAVLGRSGRYAVTASKSSVGILGDSRNPIKVVIV